MVIPGFNSRIFKIVCAQISDPPSFKSSLSTLVITVCFKFISFTDFATRKGSNGSASIGLPVATAQNPHERVQTFPNIIKVAVPALQHSPIFGQFPLEQMVCNLCSSTMFLTFLYSSPMGKLTRSQSGFLIFCTGASSERGVYSVI